MSAVGAQFENSHLEAQDFIVSEEQPPPPLFPHYYPHTGFRKAPLSVALQGATTDPTLFHVVNSTAVLDRVCLKP